MNKELAKVENVFFGIEDHGILTFIIYLDYGGSSQGFGNIGLSYHDRERDMWLDEKGAGMTMIYNILGFFGVRQFEHIKGKTVYAIKDERDNVIGLERTKFDGGAKFMLDDWRKKFWPEKYK